MRGFATIPLSCQRSVILINVKMKGKNRDREIKIVPQTLNIKHTEI